MVFKSCLDEKDQNMLEFGSPSIDQVTQRWLYFEVLVQVFGHLPRFKWQDFVRTNNASHSYITTKKLPRYLDA